MRLLVVSDSHGNEQILDDLASRYDGLVDGFVHCGDSELPATNLLWEVMDTVKGNCDYDNRYPDMVVNRDLDVPYLIVHGHRHEVKRGLESLKVLAKQERVPIVFYGHSHVLKFDFEDGIYFINPGSVQFPRGNISMPTYCLLAIEAGVLTIEVYDKNHEPIPSLTFNSDKLTNF